MLLQVQNSNAREPQRYVYNLARIAVHLNRHGDCRVVCEGVRGLPWIRMRGAGRSWRCGFNAPAIDGSPRAVERSPALTFSLVCKVRGRAGAAATQRADQ